jgi:hypothetical protein
MMIKQLTMMMPTTATDDDDYNPPPPAVYHPFSYHPILECPSTFPPHRVRTCVTLVVVHPPLSMIDTTLPIPSYSMPMEPRNVWDGMEKYYTPENLVVDCIIIQVQLYWTNGTLRLLLLMLMLLQQRSYYPAIGNHPPLHLYPPYPHPPVYLQQSIQHSHHQQVPHSVHHGVPYPIRHSVLNSKPRILNQY